MNLRAFLKGYYWATPVFFFMDQFFGANVRAAGFEGHDGMKYSYYAFCCLCAVLMHRKPNWSTPLSLTDSLMNIAVLIVTFLSPYYQWIGQVGEGFTAPSPITPERVMNFILAGGAAMVALYSGQMNSGLDMRGMRK